MWNSLPDDLLSHIFSFLQPDSLSSAKSTCRNWRKCPTSGRRSHHHQPPWFLAVPNRNRGPLCYAQNPDDSKRYILHLDFIPTQIRPVSAIGGMILFRPTAAAAALQLAVCNPFTRQFRYLPPLNVARTNPAVGVVELTHPHFRVYVAGGNGTAAAAYEPTIEMYDSGTDTWITISIPVPMEYAVRLTVWTPNESVSCNGVLYWVTSARAYSVMGFEVATNKWTELSVPIADRLEFAALVRRRNGRLTLLGGKCGGDAYAWELEEERRWRVVEKVPYELAMKFLGGKGCWDNTKCVGSDGVVCVYKDMGSGMLIWRESGDDGGKWEWVLVDGCSSIRGQQVQNLQIKGMLLHPSLDHDSSVFGSSSTV